MNGQTFPRTVTSKYLGFTFSVKTFFIELIWDGQSRGGRQTFYDVVWILN